MEKRKKTALHGRKLAVWKIVLISALVFLLAAAAAVLVFLNTYKPSVDQDGPYIAENDIRHTLSLTHSTSVERYHMASALRRFRASVLSGVVKKSTDEYGRRDGVYNFLVMGHDRVALNTDVIMIVNYDVTDGSINIVQIPRDTYIEYNRYPHKINSTLAYTYNQAYKDGEKDLYAAALSSTSELLEKAMNIQIDNYVLVNLESFSNIVNIIGGVEIDVPEDMDYDDPYQGLSIHIKKGYQTLDGQTAAQFIRFRSGYQQADIGRQDAQKLFMTALFKKVKSSMTVDKIAKLVEQIMKNVTTDISLTDAVFFAKSALSVNLDSINMMTLPGSGVYAGGVSYYVISRSQTLKVINKYLNVYNTDITDALFDQEKWFTDENNSKINAVYMSDNGTYTVSSGDDIDKDGINIPRLPYAPYKAATAETASELDKVIVKDTQTEAYEQDTTDSGSDTSESTDAPDGNTGDGIDDELGKDENTGGTDAETADANTEANGGDTETDGTGDADVTEESLTDTNGESFTDSQEDALNADQTADTN